MNALKVILIAAFISSFPKTNGYRDLRRHTKGRSGSIHEAPVMKLSPYLVSRDLLEKQYPVFASFNGTMHAGLLPASNIDTNVINESIVNSSENEYSSYFFWLFEPSGHGKVSQKDHKNVAESFRNDTLLIWLNGGPGCSSLFGALVENGPVTLPAFRAGIPPGNPASSMGSSFIPNPYGWTEKSAMLFVEQPGGVGFSTASREWVGDEAQDRTEDDVALDFYFFLQNFYQTFPELRKKKLYISGESYAGMYIPSIARGIHEGNLKVLADTTKSEKQRENLIIKLDGIAIGNGWIDVKIQGPTIIDYAFWHGMIDLRTFTSLHKKWNECIQNKITVDDEAPFHPYTTPDECGITSAVMEASGSENMYDITTYDTYPVYDDPHGTVANFLNNPDVRKALNAPSLESLPGWLSCIPGAGRRGRRKLVSSAKHSPSDEYNHRNLLMLDKDITSVVPYIAELLDDAKIRVLMYNGDLDLACNPQSTELALNSMEWSGRNEWMDPNITLWKEWIVDEQVSGHTKKFNNLEFLVVYHSGHFVPVNQARNALNLIGRFLDGESFGDEDLPQFNSISAAKPMSPIMISSYDEEKKSTVSVTTTIFGVIIAALLSSIVTFQFVTLKRKKDHIHLQTSRLDHDSFKTEITPLNILKNSTGNA